MSFRAVFAERDAAGEPHVSLRALSESDLMPGSVTVRVERSSLNYKDALAVTGKAPVIRCWPMIPGIDLAGTVLRSESPEWQEGDTVLVTGCGLGEQHFGGFAERARVPAEWLIHRRDGFTADRAMAVGTAGFTAMLSLLRLEMSGLAPDRGPVVVTGASGGVGSFAVHLLARAGYEVHAATGRPEEEPYLRELGAAEIVPRQELSGPSKPLARERWAGGIDSVGGTVLANVISMTDADGTIAACGNAGGMELPSSVAPFILRGVSLIGINSVKVAPALRCEVWSRITRDVDFSKLAGMTETVGLSEVFSAAERLLAGRVRGRIVVDVTR